jgi:unsaturated rhamnogalacturonyl hydrolase
LRSVHTGDLLSHHIHLRFYSMRTAIEVLCFILAFHRAEAQPTGFSEELKKNSVRTLLDAAVQWQLRDMEHPKHHALDWTSGALYAGLCAYASAVGDTAILQWLDDTGARFGWQPGSRMYHADDICVAQTFLDLYRWKPDRRRIDPTQARLDWVLADPPQSTLALSYDDPTTLDRWSWCDALFMAPPVYAKLSSITGDRRYRDYMHREFSATYELLYDKDEHLFYRDSRFFSRREPNGAKVFWGRGNGWVLGGLVALLKELPPDCSYRQFYVGLFTQMATRVASLQDRAGYWHAGLLDSASYPNPETSVTGFFCYAIAYGINAGILDRHAYLPCVRKAWAALAKSVSSDGRLGWVQPIGEDPRKVDGSMTEVYGVGALLLAGSEILRLEELADSPN